MSMGRVVAVPVAEPAEAEELAGAALCEVAPAVSAASPSPPVRAFTMLSRKLACAWRTAPPAATVPSATPPAAANARRESVRDASGEAWFAEEAEEEEVRRAWFDAMVNSHLYERCRPHGAYGRGGRSTSV